ncbi:MAG TPA: glycoside hydrolase family 30 protein [Puia sp.]|nr:glycoside hydrolase family 30 protein [Puia sp.]
MRKLLLAIVLISSVAYSQTNKTSSFSVAGKKLVVYTTADNTDLRLSITDTLTFNDLPQPVETQVCVFVDPSKTFQTLFGIGGALTDASAEVFAKLSKDKQQELLEAYYDPKKGIGYTLARTNIHSCDFSSDSYSYVNDNDNSLKSFSIEHDRKYRIPFIKQAIAAAGGKLTLFCSPWSPPGWMKTNNNMLHGGKLKTEYYQTWANYFVKFIRAYEKEGIPVWGVSIQNEPMATQTWESCIYSADDEKNFLKNNLGPTFAKHGLAGKKIIVWDHNRDLLYQRASTLLSDPEAAKYAWGVGFHWYEDWSGGTQMFDNVGLVHKSFPDKNLIFTEGCNDKFKFENIKSWSLGERYGRSMIHDFNNGTVGWIDWNILLDENGGPNHVGNFCFAPVHADTKTGELIYTNSFYYIGHFSKFIKPGAKRVAAASSRSAFLTTAFLNKDGKLAVIVMNQTDQTIPYKLWIAGKAADITARSHSMATIIL